MSVSITTIAPKIGRLVRLMGSDVDNEALGACRALNRTLKGAGWDLHWLADRIETGLDELNRRKPQFRPDECPHSWSTSERFEIVDALQNAIRADLLTEWEVDFAGSMLRAMAERKRLSLKQTEIIDRLLRKAWRARA